MSPRRSLSLVPATLLVCVLAWPGCGGSSGPSGSGSGQDASASSSGGSSGSSSGSSGGSSGSSSGGTADGGSSGGSGNCPSTPCTGSQVCCADIATKMSACVDSCPTGDAIGCTAPSDCGGSTPDCCGTDVLDGMDAGETFPHCTTSTLTTSCVAKCVSHIQVSCTATETLHVCTAPSDCTADTANPNCCAVSGYHVCVSNLLKALGTLTCL